MAITGRRHLARQRRLRRRARRRRRRQALGTTSFDIGFEGSVGERPVFAVVTYVAVTPGTISPTPVPVAVRGPVVSGCTARVSPRGAPVPAGWGTCSTGRSSGATRGVGADLLNKLLVRSGDGGETGRPPPGCGPRIVEVEAYCGEADPGSHAFGA